jgi:hypothetical protein
MKPKDLGKPFSTPRRFSKNAFSKVSFISGPSPNLVGEEDSRIEECPAARLVDELKSSCCRECSAWRQCFAASVKEFWLYF